MMEKIISRAGLKRDAAWSRFVFQFLAISFILHIVAAVRSTGFYYPEEHFQVVEWISFKLGHTSAVDLPFEYHHLLQPWFLPAILTLVTNFLNAIGIRNPFDWALSYRIIGSL